METVNKWLLEYAKILSSYNIQPKTLKNRMANLAWIAAKFGKLGIDNLKPYELANLLKIEHAKFPSRAKRLLFEVRNMYKEANIYCWTEKNPASYLKPQRVSVARQRLSLIDWRLLYNQAYWDSARWVPIMLLLALVTGQRRSDLLKMSYDDVHDGCLHVSQQKTGVKLAIPLALKLHVIDLSLGELIDMSMTYDGPGPTLLRKHDGNPPCAAYMSASFEKLVDTIELGKNVSLHECRSLAERLYREQGLNTRLLLGHKHQSMTDLYNDDRGLNRNTYTKVPL